MIIKSLHNSYEVTGVYEKEDGIERYDAREQNRQSEHRIIRIMRKEWITGTISYFSGKEAQSSFTDFQECFMEKTSLCLVFPACRGLTLERKLSEQECMLEERLQIFQDLLSRLALLGLPPYFAWDCLREGGIYVEENGSVGFLYRLPLAQKLPDEVESAADGGFEAVLQQLQNVYERLFREELKRKTVKPLALFLQKLEEARMGGYLEIFEAFSVIRKQCGQETTETEAVPETLPFKLWERLRGLVKPLKRIIVLLLIAASICFLVYTIMETGKPGEQKTVFESIGTVKIKE